MNKSLEVLKSIYKPYRYTIKGKVTVIETTSGDFIIKEKKKDVRELFQYLSSRSFFHFPKLIDDSRKDVNVFEYIEDIKMPIEQKAEDLIDIIGKLHNNTSYFKEVSEDTYKTIYEDIKSNVIYFQEYYNSLYENYFKEVYSSPAMYLFLRNFNKLKASLDFVSEELDSWYEIVRKETKIRVSVIHNNLELDHYLKSDADYLISWDDYKIDTPILDIVNFYHKEYQRINFEVLLEKYMHEFNLFEYEKKLLFILIALPLKIEDKDNEFLKVKEMRKFFDYIFKTESLLRPYYAKNEEEKEGNF